MKINICFVLFSFFIQLVAGYFYEKQNAILSHKSPSSFISLGTKVASSLSLNLKAQSKITMIYKINAFIISTTGKVKDLKINVNLTPENLVISTPDDEKQVAYTE